MRSRAFVFVALLFLSRLFGFIRWRRARLRLGMPIFFYHSDSFSLSLPRKVWQKLLLCNSMYRVFQKTNKQTNGVPPMYVNKSQTLIKIYVEYGL